MAQEKLAPREAAQQADEMIRQLVQTGGVAALIPRPGMPSPVAERAALNRADERAAKAKDDLRTGLASPLNRALPVDEKTMKRAVEERYTPEERAKYQQEIEYIYQLAQQAGQARKQNDTAGAAAYEAAARLAFDTLNYIDTTSKRLEAMGDQQMAKTVRDAFRDAFGQGSTDEETALMRWKAVAVLRGAGAYAEHQDTIKRPDAPLAAWIGTELRAEVMRTQGEGFSALDAQKAAGRINAMELKLANFRSFEATPKPGGYSDSDLELSKRELLVERTRYAESSVQMLREHQTFEQLPEEIRQRADMAAWFLKRAEQLEKAGAGYTDTASNYLMTAQFLLVNVTTEMPAGSAAASVISAASALMERDGAGEFKTLASIEAASAETARTVGPANIEAGARSIELNAESLGSGVARSKKYTEDERASINRSLARVQELGQQAMAAASKGDMQTADRALLLSKTLLDATAQYITALDERKGMRLPVTKVREQFQQLTDRADAALAGMRANLAAMAGLDPAAMETNDMLRQLDSMEKTAAGAFDEAQNARTEAELLGLDATRKGYAGIAGERLERLSKAAHEYYQKGDHDMARSLLSIGLAYKETYENYYYRGLANEGELLQAAEKRLAKEGNIQPDANLLGLGRRKLGAVIDTLCPPEGAGARAGIPEARVESEINIARALLDRVKKAATHAKEARLRQSDVIARGKNREYKPDTTQSDKDITEIGICALRGDINGAVTVLEGKLNDHLNAEEEAYNRYLEAPELLAQQAAGLRQLMGSVSEAASELDALKAQIDEKRTETDDKSGSAMSSECHNTAEQLKKARDNLDKAQKHAQDVMGAGKKASPAEVRQVLAELDRAKSEVETLLTKAGGMQAIGKATLASLSAYKEMGAATGGRGALVHSALEELYLAREAQAKGDVDAAADHFSQANDFYLQVQGTSIGVRYGDARVYGSAKTANDSFAVMAGKKEGDPALAAMRLDGIYALGETEIRGEHMFDGVMPAYGEYWVAGWMYLSATTTRMLGLPEEKEYEVKTGYVPYRHRVAGMRSQLSALSGDKVTKAEARVLHNEMMRNQSDAEGQYRTGADVSRAMVDIAALVAQPVFIVSATAGAISEADKMGWGTAALFTTIVTGFVRGVTRGIVPPQAVEIIGWRALAQKMASGTIRTMKDPLAAAHTISTLYLVGSAAVEVRESYHEWKKTGDAKALGAVIQTTAMQMPIVGPHMEEVGARVKGFRLREAAAPKAKAAPKEAGAPAVEAERPAEAARAAPEAGAPAPAGPEVTTPEAPKAPVTKPTLRERLKLAALAARKAARPAEKAPKAEEAALAMAAGAEGEAAAPKAPEKAAPQEKAPAAAERLAPEAEKNVRRVSDFVDRLEREGPQGFAAYAEALQAMESLRADMANPAFERQVGPEAYARIERLNARFNDIAAGAERTLEGVIGSDHKATAKGIGEIIFGAEREVTIIEITRGDYDAAKAELSPEIRRNPERYAEAMRERLKVPKDAVVAVEGSSYETILINDPLARENLATERGRIFYKDTHALYVALTNKSEQGVQEALGIETGGAGPIEFGMIALDKGRTWLLNRIRREFGNAGLLLYFKTAQNLQTEFGREIGYKDNLPTVRLTETGDEVAIVVPKEFAELYAKRHERAYESFAERYRKTHADATDTQIKIEFTMERYTERLGIEMQGLAEKLNLKSDGLNDAITAFTAHSEVVTLRPAMERDGTTKIGPDGKPVLEFETIVTRPRVRYGHLGDLLNGVETRARIKEVEDRIGSEAAEPLKIMARAKGPQAGEALESRPADGKKADMAIGVRVTGFASPAAEKAFMELAGVAGKAVANVEAGINGPSLLNECGHNGADHLKWFGVYLREQVNLSSLKGKVEVYGEGAMGVELVFTKPLTAEETTTLNSVMGTARVRYMAKVKEDRVILKKDGVILEAELPIGDIRLYKAENMDAVRGKIEADMLFMPEDRARLGGQPPVPAGLDTVNGQIGAILHLDPEVLLTEEQLNKYGAPPKHARDPSAVKRYYEKQGFDIYGEAFRRFGGRAPEAGEAARPKLTVIRGGKAEAAEAARPAGAEARAAVPAEAESAKPTGKARTAGIEKEPVYAQIFDEGMPLAEREAQQAEFRRILEQRRKSREAPGARAVAEAAKPARAAPEPMAVRDTAYTVSRTWRILRESGHAERDAAVTQFTLMKGSEQGKVISALRQNAAEERARGSELVKAGKQEEGHAAWDRADHSYSQAIYLQELAAFGGRTGRGLEAQYGLAPGELSRVYASAPGTIEARKAIIDRLGIQQYDYVDDHLFGIFATGDIYEVLRAEMTSDIESLEMRNVGGGATGAYMAKASSDTEQYTGFFKKVNMLSDRRGSENLAFSGVPAPDVIISTKDGRPLEYVNADGKVSSYGISRNLAEFDGTVTVMGRDIRLKARSAVAFDEIGKSPELMGMLLNQPDVFYEQTGYTFAAQFATGAIDGHEGNTFAMTMEVVEPTLESLTALRKAGYQVKTAPDGKRTVFMVGRIDTDDAAGSYLVSGQKGSFDFTQYYDRMGKEEILPRVFTRLAYLKNQHEIEACGAYRFEIPADRADAYRKKNWTVTESGGKYYVETYAPEYARKLEKTGHHAVARPSREPRLVTPADIVREAFGTAAEGPFLRGVRRWAREHMANPAYREAMINTFRRNEGEPVGISSFHVGEKGERRDQLNADGVTYHPGIAFNGEEHMPVFHGDGRGAMMPEYERVPGLYGEGSSAPWPDKVLGLFPHGRAVYVVPAEPGMKGMAGTFMMGDRAFAVFAPEALPPQLAGKARGAVRLHNILRAAPGFGEMTGIKVQRLGAVPVFEHIMDLGENGFISASSKMRGMAEQELTNKYANGFMPGFGPP